MSFAPKTLRNLKDLPREECSREVCGKCLGGSCNNMDACRGGKNNIRRGIVEQHDRRQRHKAAFHAAIGHLPGYNEEDILVLCLDRGLAREQVVCLMEAGISLETIERAPDAAIQIALEG